MRTVAALFFCIFICFAAYAAEQAPLVDFALPEISLPNLDGKTTNLQEIAQQKPFILTFFTSWSKSCQEQLLDLENISKENKKVAVIAVSFDKKQKDLKAFVDKNNLTFPILQDKKLTSLDKFQILTIPTTFCINNDGIIEKTFIDYDENVKNAVEEWSKP